MSMKNSNDTIGKRTRYFPACSAVPQPTELLRAPCNKYVKTIFLSCISKFCSNVRYMKWRVFPVRIFVGYQMHWQLVASLTLVIFMSSVVKNVAINNKQMISVTCEGTYLFERAASRELKGISVTRRACKDEQKKHTCISCDTLIIHVAVWQ